MKKSKTHVCQKSNVGNVIGLLVVVAGIIVAVSAIVCLHCKKCKQKLDNACCANNDDSDSLDCCDCDCDCEEDLCDCTDEECNCDCDCDCDCVPEEKPETTETI